MTVRDAAPQAGSPRGAGSGAPAPVTRPREEDAPPRFRPDIEGLRALAVLAVLAFHASVPWATGGFVGVDVFFVISGFLITGLLVAEARTSGTVRLGDFYARRARRILPAAGLVLVATGVASALLLPALRLLDVTWDLLASAAYVANWRFVDAQVDYLAAGRDHSPLLHFWSLAVEEQFYLLWPAVVLLAAVLARRTRLRLGPLVAGACTLLTVASLALSLHLTRTSEPVAYMSSPTRAWQFGVGGLVAVGAPHVWRAARRPAVGRLLALGGWAGIAAVTLSVVTFDDTTAYPGTAALLPTLGTALVVLAGLDREPRALPRISRLFALPYPRYLGRLSYAWYLWHWPVVVLAGEVLGDLTWPQKVALALLSALPAELSMRVLEAPLRFSPRVATSVRVSAAVGAIAMAVPLSAGVGLRQFGEASVAAAAAPRPSQEALQTAMTTPGSDLWRDEGAVTPGPATARVNRPVSGDCLMQPDRLRSRTCIFGDPTASRRVVLFGDSHAEQWFTPLERVAAENGYRVRVFSKAACPPLIMEVPHPWTRGPYTACDAWRSWALDRIDRERPDVIVVGSSLYPHLSDEDAPQRGWDLLHERLQATGAVLVYLRDTPIMGIDIPVCVSGAVGDWSDCAVERDEALAEDPVAARIRGRHHDVRVIDLTSYLCPGDPCPAVRDGVMLYRDHNHITDDAARGLLPVLRGALEPVLGP